MNDQKGLSGQFYNSVHKACQNISADVQEFLYISYYSHIFKKKKDSNVIYALLTRYILKFWWNNKKKIIKQKHEKKRLENLQITCQVQCLIQNKVVLILNRSLIQNKTVCKYGPNYPHLTDLQWHILQLPHF